MAPTVHVQVVDGGDPIAGRREREGHRLRAQQQAATEQAGGTIAAASPFALRAQA
jgi:hypothetical protein